MNYKHGMYGLRFYSIYRSILTRCKNSNSKTYQFYGARNIIISKKWSQFEQFKKDMYLSYLEHCEIHGEHNTSIERKNNSKGYSKGNCKWATRKQQCRNRRSNILLTFNGKQQTLKEWSEDLKINYGTLKSRLKRSKWSLKKAFYTPVT